MTPSNRPEEICGSEEANVILLRFIASIWASVYVGMTILQWHQPENYNTGFALLLCLPPMLFAWLMVVSYKLPVTNPLAMAAAAAICELLLVLVLGGRYLFVLVENPLDLLYLLGAPMALGAAMGVVGGVVNWVVTKLLNRFSPAT